jgi:hypothetical protein
MTDLTVDEEESRSPWKRIVAVLCVVGLIFAMVAGGFLALFMGIIASSAGAVGSDGSGCVPTSTTASASWGDATSTRPTPPGGGRARPPPPPPRGGGGGAGVDELEAARLVDGLGELVDG